MPKLTLKETLQEKEEKEWRRIRQEARKAAKYLPDGTEHIPQSNFSTIYKRTTTKSRYDYVYDDDDDLPRASSFKVDKEAMRAQLEEDDFNAKLFDAMGMDAGRDDSHAYFNSYHIPTRWRDGPSSSSGSTAAVGGDAAPDLSMMSEGEYAEHIRRGMWRRQHREEEEARERRKREREERKKREKALKEETKRIEREEQERYRRRKMEKESHKLVDAWKEYNDKWSGIQKKQMSGATAAASESDSLDFGSLPWPIVISSRSPTSPDALHKESIAAFLLSDKHSTDKTTKQRLREASLLYHPDRFESKVMPLVREKDRNVVKEAAGRVIRALNALAEEHR